MPHTPRENVDERSTREEGHRKVDHERVDVLQVPHSARLESHWASEHVAESWTEVAAGPGVLIALAGIVLGILGLAEVSPIILSLAAMLSYGFAVLLSGTALAGRLLAVFA